MKTVCDLNMCTGCSACVEVCPKMAVSMRDTIKELNAIIDEDKCIQCRTCEKVCQQISPVELKKPMTWYQGWTSDAQSRSKSSSGGFAYHLMYRFVREGGTVCACSFSAGDFTYEFASGEDDLEVFRGSKYVKSNPKNVYTRIKSLLQSGNKVLFIGLPCHVAAVRRFAGEKYNDILYTVDLICHGSPSIKILSGFLDEKGFPINNLSNIAFRQKNKFRIITEVNDCEKEISFTPQGVRDRYTIGFLNGLFYTENCYHCRYAGINRVSDITLGDSWGSELEGNDEGTKGISLALCQTEKGEDLLKRSGLNLMPVDIDKAINANHNLREPSKMPEERVKFFSLIESGTAVNSAILKCYPQTCIRQDVKSILTKLHMLTHQGG